MSSNQRFVLMLAAMALAGIAMMRVAPAQQAAPSLAANVQEAVYARRFVLVDEQGKPCAAIQRVDGGTEGPHRTEFVILDESGKELAAMDDNAGFGGQLLLHSSFVQQSLYGPNGKKSGRILQEGGAGTTPCYTERRDNCCTGAVSSRPTQRR